MRMINRTKKVLENVLRNNYAMIRTQEREEDLQHQEEAWIKNERISKAQEESQERKKQSKMDTCMNKEQQVSECQQAAKPQQNT